MVNSIEATAVLHNIHTMMRIEEGEEEEEDDQAANAQEGDERRRRHRLVNDINPENSSSDEDENAAQPVRLSKEAVRAEGQALRDSILSAYFSANF